MVDLDQSVLNTHVREVTMIENYRLRDFTRGQAKKLVTDKEPVNKAKDQETLDKTKITPETMFLPSYSLNDIQMLQRQDRDLEILHSWLDKKISSNKR